MNRRNLNLEQQIQQLLQDIKPWSISFYLDYHYFVHYHYIIMLLPRHFVLITSISTLEVMFSSCYCLELELIVVIVLGYLLGLFRVSYDLDIAWSISLISIYCCLFFLYDWYLSQVFRDVSDHTINQYILSYWWQDLAHLAMVVPSKH